MVKTSIHGFCSWNGKQQDVAVAKRQREDRWGSGRLASESAFLLVLPLRSLLRIMALRALSELLTCLLATASMTLSRYGTTGGTHVRYVDVSTKLELDNFGELDTRERIFHKPTADQFSAPVHTIIMFYLAVSCTGNIYIIYNI